MTKCKDTGLDTRPIEEIEAEFARKREAEEAAATRKALLATQERAHHAGLAMEFLADHIASGGVRVRQSKMGWHVADTGGITAVLYLAAEAVRLNAGYGLWQLAFGSKADLTDANYALARAAMQSFRTDNGRLLGVMPNTLVVPPALEEAALYLLNTEIKDGGGSNPWKGTAKLIVTPCVTE